MEFEKAINRCIFGYILAFILLILFAMLWFYVECPGLVVCCIILAVIQLVFICITPYSYVFSKECLVIKYPFGKFENIPWQDVRAVVSYGENVFRFTMLDTYRFYYYSKEKNFFYMRGVVSKNKKITKLMKKYCTKNLRYYFE